MRIRPALAALLAGLAGCLAAAVLQDGPRERGEDALRDRDYARAAALLAEAHAAAKDGRDEILYLLAVAQARGGKPVEALATLDRLLQEHPQSPLRRKAAFKRGDVLAARKDFAAASAVYDDGLKAIVDPVRRAALAAVYLDTARELLVPKDPKDLTFKPDYPAALRLLQKALELDALGADAEAAARADVVLCHARGAVPGGLLAACLAYEGKFPQGARLDEVLYAKGEALLASHRVDHAEKAWTDLATRFPASPKAADALLRAAALYQPRMGGESLRAALRLLRRAAKDYAAGPDGPRAAMALADALASSEELHDEARAAYRAAVDGFPKDTRAPEALSRIADLHAADGADAKAIEVFDDLLKRYPDSPAWSRARQRIADLRFERLRPARLRRDWAGLRTAAQEFADAHAADPRVSEALSELAAAFREEKKFREAADAYLRIAAKYAGADLEHKARLDAATTLAEDLGETETALKELERVKGSHAAAAEALARRLREPALSIASERVFTSAEAPAASLTVRNIETLRLRLWTLDLRDYFDKKSSTSGLQDLEVSVIAPDQEWELKVPGYVRHKEFKIPAPLPRKDPGAYVVLASAGALEAKTIVLVSDLALAARAGRAGAAVLVQNQRTGERVAAPSTLVAADGKALKAWTPDTAAGRLSFLATDQGHAAFRDLRVENLPVPFRRAPTALVIPDRKIVRANEDVRVRLWIRDVAGNAYVPPKDKTYRLVAARDPGPAFWDVDVVPTALGAASATLRLPASAAGAIRLSLYERAKPREILLGQASVTVGVEAARLPRVDFLLPDAPVLAGDAVDVPCVLRDAWGRPLPGRRLEVTTSADLVPREVRTGTDGAFLIAFRDTQVFGRQGSLFARVSDGSRTDELTIAVFPRSPLPRFDASSRFGEPAAAGEARAVAFTANTADGAPFAGPFRWAVRRVDAAGARIAVAAGDVVTDAQGRAAFSFTPKERGPHAVEVLAKDADGVPAAAFETLEVFDDGEERKIRILSASDVFEPGVPFEVTVLSRLEKGTAYVTVEGETIEQTLPVVLDKGRTTVKLGPPPGKSKDFTVTALVMRDGKFHADVRPFLLKPAEPKLEPARETARPGEEVAVKVTARPGVEVLFVASEELTATVGPGLFLEPRRGEYFIGDSSVETSFAGVTKELDAQVLNAMARLASLEKSSVQVMMPIDLPDAKGIGGGGGGAFGSRMGGKRNLVTRGGGGTGKVFVPGAPEADPAPIVFAAATAGADGTATFTVRAPPGHADVALAAWTLDGANRIGVARGTLKVRADVTAEIRAPASAVEGEKTSIVALLTNRAAEEREAVLALDGAETRVKVPARSTLERALEWTAAETATVVFDGLPRELRTSIRPVPSTWNEGGGAFTARAELKLHGQGKTVVRYATSPQALLDALAEPEDSESGRAARLIARLARHRIAPSDAARLAVMEFAAWRWPNAADEAREDEAWPVLSYLAAAEAKADGFEIEPDAARLKERFARASHDDVKALQLFALARGGETQYGYLHRLWRNPDALSPRALACVALALKSLGRPDEAKDAAARLAKRVKEDHWDAADVPAADLSNTTYVATALAALALAEIEPADALLPKARAWLLARAPSGAFERAALALALRSTPDRSAVTALRIGGREVAGAGEVAVDAAVAEPVGQGTFYVLARRATGQAPAPPAGVTLKRTIGWPGLVVEGRPIHGRTTVTEAGGTSMPRVAAGQSFQIHYEITLKGPLAGYRVVELDRLAGLRTSMPPRALVKPTTSETVTLRHTVYAYADLPGPSAVLEILPAGADFRAGWTPSPGERLGAGTILFESGKWKEARELLLPIFDAPAVPDALAAPAARMLAFAAAELGEHETVVRFFEVLKEKAPEAVVPFDKIRAVGRAYAAAKEFERAMQVVSGTCDAYFLQEANLPGALEDLGRVKASTERLKALLLDHPDTALNREMRVGLGTRLASAARTAEDVAPSPLTMSKADLLAEAAAALERFLAWHPEDAAGDRASLTLGSVYLEAGNYARAERTSKAAAARYPKSRFVDGFDYTTAFALFARRSFADALAMCDRLETFDYGANANPGPAVMRERAILMKAQIHHAKGELDKALENYKKVRETSPDAARSAAFLERETISVPETTPAPLARPAEIELEHAGVAEAHVRAYRVDLTTLALRRKNLSDPAAVEVAGIRPVFEKTFKLDVPHAKRREKQKLVLDLKLPGAYLVGVKAGDFFASGLVLRGDLAMSAQEGNPLRLNVTNAATGAFEEGVKVTVVGRTGIDTTKTDLRGVAESSVDQGGSTVVAEKDGHVATYVTAGRYANVFGSKRQAEDPKPGSLDALQEQLKDANKQLEDDFRGNQRRTQQGVEVERTKK